MATNMPEPVQAAVHSVRRSVPNFAISIPNPALEASHILSLKNNLHTASFVTEKDMCAYRQMMKAQSSAD
jgi:hypothetical protein